MYDTLVLTVGTVAKTLKKINQDKYAGEFLLRETGGEFTAKIKHSTYVDSVRKVSVERHSIEFIQKIYGTSGAPDTIRKTYTVIENDRTDLVSDVAKVPDAVADWLIASTNLVDIVNWAS